MIGYSEAGGYPTIITSTDIYARYTQLDQRKQATWARAQRYSEYTLPYVAPLITDGENQTEVTFDLNAIGPRAIQYLSNKYMMTLFPPNRSTFKLELPPKISDALGTQGLDAKAVAITIGQMEDEAKKYLASINSRSALLECLEHLFITGNVLLHYPKTGSMQVYALDQYVIRRQLDGRIAEIITRDYKALIDLPENYQNVIIEKLQIKADQISTYQCTLYTQALWDGKKYTITQSVEHVLVGKSYRVTEKKLRWLPLTLRRYRRETYGRGLVEDYINVFHALSVLQECLLTAAAIATDVKYTVTPGSMLDIPTLTQSPSGSYHIGNKDDIGNTGLDGRLSDLQFVEAMIQRLERLIGSVFLINSSVTRDAERVTREEIRLQAQELETAHGGVYSLLNEELLLPIAHLTLDSIDVNLGESDFEPVILTGLDAMARSSINDNIMVLFQQVAQLENVPDEIKAEIDPVKLWVTLSAGLDVDPTKILKTEQEKATDAANQNAQQEKALTDQAVAQGLGQQIGSASPEVAAAMAQQL